MPVTSYHKFLVHLRQGGVRYACARVFKYFKFLNSIRRSDLSPRDFSISSGKLKVVLDASRVRIFYAEDELTSGVGLDVALATVGGWSDSSLGVWSVVKRDDTSFVLKNKWRYLPVTLLWDIALEGESKIAVHVTLQAEEGLKILKARALLLVSPEYPLWVNAHRQGEFAESAGEVLQPNHAELDPWVGVYPQDATGFPGIIAQLSGSPDVSHTQLLTHALLTAGSMVHILGFDHPNDCYYPEGAHEFLAANIYFPTGRDFRTLVRSLKDHAPAPVFAVTHTGTHKVLLVNLPWERDGRWGVRAGSRWPHIKDDAEEGRYLSFPFFLAYAASLLKSQGIDAHLIDAIAEKMPETRLQELIESMAPEMVVAETSTPSFSYDMALLSRLSNKKFRLCVCGPDMSIRNPQFLKDHPFIDYVLVGEYEQTLSALLQALAQGSTLHSVKGLIFREGNQVVCTPPAPLADLNKLPWPVREGMPLDAYRDTPGGIPLPSAQIVASRGCIFKCSFCLWPQVMYQGTTYRVRDVADVVNEMEYLVKKMGFKSVYFDDDTFNIGKERMLQFCSQIKARGLDKVPWAIMARADLMDEEILTRMKEAGLVAVKYGVESGSQALVNNCGKRLDLKKAEKMIRFTHQLRIKTHLTFTFGLPGETKETIRKTIEFALRLKPFSVQFSITTPFPGTSYFNDLEKQGNVVSKNWDDYDGNFKSVIKLDTLSTDDLEEARRMACAAWEATQRGELAVLSGDVRDKAAGILRAPLEHSSAQPDECSAPAVAGKPRQSLDVLGILHGRYAFEGPATLQIDLTDFCNNDCLACWCNSPLLTQERRDKKKYQLPTPLVMDLISDAHAMGLKDIYFSGGGEPFMHPDLLAIVAHAKGLGISCGINTNFTLVDEEKIRRLAELNVDHITVSIWSGSAGVYKELHPNKSEKDFYGIVERLKLLNSIKTHGPVVKIYNVICNRNYHQIEAMLDLAELTKCEYMEFTVVDTMPDQTDKLILNQQQAREVLAQFDRLQARISRSPDTGFPVVLNLETFLRRVANLDAQKAEYDSQFIDTMPCYIGWLFARIMPNGDVNSCLKSHRFPVGNLHEQSFRKIWNGKKQVFFRRKTLSVKKSGKFFALIGNDPECKVGCYKSCDDIGRIRFMHERISRLTPVERKQYRELLKSGTVKPVC